MRRALSDVSATIDYLNTHGTSTPLGDMIEAARREPGIRRRYAADFFDQVAFRHSLGAAGVHEAIYCLLMMRDGFLAGSANIDVLDPDCASTRSCAKRAPDPSAP